MFATTDDLIEQVRKKGLEDGRTIIYTNQEFVDDEIRKMIEDSDEDEADFNALQGVYWDAFIESR